MLGSLMALVSLGLDEFCPLLSDRERRSFHGGPPAAEEESEDEDGGAAAAGRGAPA